MALIHFSKSDRIKIAAWLARVPVRAGISAGGSNWSFQFSTPFEVPGRIGHKIHLFQELVDWLAGPGTEPQPLPLIPEILGGGDGLETLRSHGWGGGPYCVLAPMPHQRAPHRQWFPLDAPWLELCRLMKAEGVTPVFVGGPEHKEYLDRLALAGGALSLAGQTRLSQLAALFAKAHGAICVDTGLAHMAGGSGRPTVIIFGTGRESVDIACGPHVVALRGAPAGEYGYPVPPGAFDLASDALCRSTARIPAIRAWRVLNALAAEATRQG
jgi:ADP-heptose:LPS heptosyltransferase